MAKNKKNSVKRRDWQAIILCVLAAATFWFFNAMNDDYTANISYPVEIVYDKDKVIPVSQLPAKVTFNATGFGWDFLKKSLRIENKPIYLKPANLPEKGYITSSELFPVISTQIQDIRINYVVLDTLFFDFENLASKRVQLIIDSTKLSLAENYKLTTPVFINPDSITLLGPQPLIDSLRDSLFVVLPQKEVKGEFEEEIKIDLGMGPNLKVSNNTVKVRFEAYPFVQKSMILPFKKVSFPEDSIISLSDSTVILTYYVQEGKKTSVMAEDFKVLIDYRRLDENDQTIKPVLTKYPEFIRDFYFTPSAIKLKYE